MAENTIQQIKSKLASIQRADDPFLEEVKEDSRKGVQKLYEAWKKQYNRTEQEKEIFFKMRKHEEHLWEQGFQLIGGVDEVGRGPLAGPVVACCVILSPEFFLPGLTDSKKLSKQKREEYFHRIQEEAQAIGVGMATAEEIDQLNIYEATKVAMNRAIRKLEQIPDFLLLDAMKLTINIPQTSLIKGDSKSISIAASSVIAKVTRDRYMEDLAKVYPEYGFERHMGYGTGEHLEALKQHGITKEHRRSFSPVQDAMSLF
ncbi:ribonuclease HII [Evansella vedderi]|uniref:Ribonuclease HII n=1 Tax=Evansella vedderi TaxID=38282 RepID=A0ABT9ZR68_9BACI|nr:ribonuclease HII [Evansella vedderi]MDQ0253732.1 ribonuclease HII [Evansella vedderi]